MPVWYNLYGVCLPVSSLCVSACVSLCVCVRVLGSQCCVQSVCVCYVCVLCVYVLCVCVCVLSSQCYGAFKDPFGRL